MIDVLVNGSDGSYRHAEFESVIEAYRSIFNWLYVFGNNLDIVWKEDDLITVTHGPTGSIVFVINVEGTEGLVGHA